jgi:hypothetical protein
MTYEEFEWNILKLAYEDGLERFQPSYLAYALGLPHETVSTYLEQATHAGLIEMDVTEDGRLEYFVPGVEGKAALPQPVWKDQLAAEAAADANAASPTQQPDETVSLGHDGAVADSKPQQALPSANKQSATDPSANKHDNTEQNLPTNGLVRADSGGLTEKSTETTDGSLDGVARDRALVRRRPPKANRVGRSQLPPALRAHIQARYGAEDGSVTDGPPGASVAVLDREATVNDADNLVVEGQLVKADEPSHSTHRNHNPNNLPARVDTDLDTFTDPSQTIFMRQLKVYGVKSEKALREHVERLFGSFGYKAVHVGGQRMRFERGSVTFILALVPLFVLVLPLFVYLFLYCMGRSTIQQEPIELDVQFRKLGDEQGTYEIDLTFIGMHGVVLGAADQRVLNQEVDTLRDELQWALSTG